MANTFELSPITVLMGHAGVGKTNVALGLSVTQAQVGRDVTLADLDVVNPYFRSSDYPGLLREHDIRLIAPVLARTTLDTPSLTGELDAAIGQTLANDNARLIIDVGGDDDGATTIGRWSGMLRDAGDAVRVFYVVSAFRALTTEPAAAAAMLPDIEEHAHLRADAVLNTSNLGDETTLEHVEAGRAFAREVAELCGLPLAATIVPAVAVGSKPAVGSEPTLVQSPQRALNQTDAEPLIVMPRYVRVPWDS